MALGTRATVLMSGGIDSTACAHFLKGQGYAVDGIFIDHGQAARVVEARAVRAIAQALQIGLTCFTVEGATSRGIGELVGRNAFLVSAGLFLMPRPSGLLALGIHAGTPYFDCSPAFADQMTRLLSEQTDGQVGLSTPFLTWHKHDVFDYFLAAGLPLRLTYSCEAGTEPTCGRCASCRDRQALDAS